MSGQVMSSIGAPGNSWGRFTVYGSAALESRATSLAHAIRSAAESCLPADTIRALVLLGGYGRGEGGVEETDGAERLHNNFDILLIHPSGRAPTQQDERALREQLDALETGFGVGIDVGRQSDGYLRRAPSLVMWYDMRHGHKTLLGDDRFVPSLTRFREDRIPASDVRNLLVNRAALLVINDFLMDHARDTTAIRRTILKHAAKAVIGYGDALLHLHGQYHWSYRVKQERMAKLRGAPGDFRAVYHEAATFRLRPRYGPGPGVGLESWLSRLGEVLEPVHLECEAARLAAPALRWREYPRTATWTDFTGDLLNPRRTATKLRNLLAPSSGVEGRRLPGGLAGRALGLRGLLPIALPAVLYPRAREAFGTQVAEAFGVEASDGRALRRAFLRHWRDCADRNLDLALRRVGLDPRILEDGP